MKSTGIRSPIYSLLLILFFSLNLVQNAVAQGRWSDVSYIPSGVSNGQGAATGNVVEYSPNLGVAYTSSDLRSIKYAYWSAGVFKFETIASPLLKNISYVRLAYLSNRPNAGIPLVFFSSGEIGQTKVMMAVRNTASLTETGRWRVGVIDGESSPNQRALEVAVSPIDQVALVYQTSRSPVANAIRFVHCSQNCHSPQNYVSQGTTGNSRIDRHATASQTQLGLGWCQMSRGVYNPAVAYGETSTHHKFAICNTGTQGNNLSTCMSNVGWTRTTASISATGFSGMVNHLLLDPHILGDTPKITTKDMGGARLSMNSTAVGCNRVVAGTIYTTFGSAALTGWSFAHLATSSLKILKEQDYFQPENERYYLVTNQGGDGVMWAASSTSRFLGRWNANGMGWIHSVPLYPQSATNIGATINPRTKQIVTSYGTPRNPTKITLGIIDDYSNPGVPISSSNVYYHLPLVETPPAP